MKWKLGMLIVFAAGTAATGASPEKPEVIVAGKTIPQAMKALAESIKAKDVKVTVLDDKILVEKTLKRYRQTGHWMYKVGAWELKFREISGGVNIACTVKGYILADGINKTDEKDVTAGESGEKCGRFLQNFAKDQK